MDFALFLPDFYQLPSFIPPKPFLLFFLKKYNIEKVFSSKNRWKLVRERKLYFRMIKMVIGKTEKKGGVFIRC